MFSRWATSYSSFLRTSTIFEPLFFAAANVAPSRFLRMVVRRFCELCRTVPELVFALVFVIAFGLGPVAGVLAVAIHTVGALGKLFAEVVENIDMKPVEGISSTGASWVQTVRFAVLPQVMPGFASYGLLRFEINVRGAAVMGFVGAGGIGTDLMVAIRKFYYSDVSAILLLIIATVMVIDLVTERLGDERRRAAPCVPVHVGEVMKGRARDDPAATSRRSPRTPGRSSAEPSCPRSARRTAPPPARPPRPRCWRA